MLTSILNFQKCQTPGASAGTSGYSYRLEGIEIRLVEKGKAGPTSTIEAYKTKTK